MKFIYFTLTILGLTILSCDRIKNKGQEIADKTEQKVKSKSKDLVDKAFPQFDSDKPDTKYNKKRFEEYLEVKLTPDIKEIYCFGDFLGIDYKVLFSFTCDSTTIKRIIDKKKLELTDENNDSGLLFMDDFNWWNKEKIEKIRPFKNGKENEFWQYLWYDKDGKKAYYEAFSL
ncbi:MAG TPA: hypothetical protein VLZ83_12600 [Edaphocola sp.]|nr:hypothetical protein [Edaphocola sp.]